MSGALSGDPISAYSPHMSTHGIPMHANGIPAPHTPFTTSSISEETAKKIATLQVRLDQRLGPEYISQRPGPGGGPKLTYVEGWKIINLANEVFGFNGWSSSIVNLSTDFADYFEETKKYCIGVTAIVRVTLRDGVFHEDIGYGTIENTKSKGAGLDKCKKEAVTDGLKRALRNFGNVLGNCLYDKSYTAEIVKVKVEPPKFKTDELHRRPEFQEVKPNVPSAPTVKPQARPLEATNNYATPSRGPMKENRPQCQSSSNLRTEIQSTNTASKLPHPPAHPITPAATPMHPPQRPLQQDKRVSFSNPTVPQAQPGSSKTPKHEVDFDSDDTFGLNDEEFLALADLAADIGRPIGQDDVGRPIDQEDSLSKTTHEVKKIETRASEQQIKKPDDGKKPTRDEVIFATLKAQGDNIANGKASLEQTKTTLPTPGVANFSRPHPAQSRPAAVSSALPISASSRSTSVEPVEQQHKAPAPSMAQRLYQNYLKKQHLRNDGKYPTDQNQKYQTNEPISVTKNPSVPAMGGGFNFNSGSSMNLTPSSTSSTPVIGVKRPAEAMSTGLGLSAQVRAPATSFKGGRPGMGLQHAVPVPRHALGAVEIEDREDVKRVKL